MVARRKPNHPFSTMSPLWTQRKNLPFKNLNLVNLYHKYIIYIYIYIGEEGRDKCLIPDERTELEVAKVPMSAIQNEEHYKLHKTPKLKKRIYMHTDTQHKESTQF